MTEENKAELEAEEPKAVEAEGQDAVIEDEGSEDKGSNTTINYEELLAKETEAREKAEKAAADAAFKLRKQKREEPTETEDETDEDKPLTARQFQEMLAQERQANQKVIQSVQADKLADGLSSSEAEKKLILEIYNNRTFPKHLSLEEQIEESYAIANRKKIMGENAELKRALAGKKTLTTSAPGTHRDGVIGNEPKLSASDKIVLAETGMTYNAASKRYEKKTSGGLMVWDAKTRKVTVLGK